MQLKDGLTLFFRPLRATNTRRADLAALKNGQVVFEF